MLLVLCVAGWAHGTGAQVHNVPLPDGWTDVTTGAPEANLRKLSPEQRAAFTDADVIAAGVDLRGPEGTFRANYQARLLSAIPLTDEVAKKLGQMLVERSGGKLGSASVVSAPGQPRIRVQIQRGDIPVLQTFYQVPDGRDTLMVVYTYPIGTSLDVDEWASRIRFRGRPNPPSERAAWIRLVNGATTGNISEIRSALDDGANVNDEYPVTTPLGYAASNGHVEAARYLITRGAATNKRYGLPLRCALHDAALKGHLPMVRFLVESGADINLRNKHGRTALYYASTPTFPLEPSANSEAVVKYLKSKGATL